MQNTSKLIHNFLDDRKEILVVSHYSPDGDAIGSLLAMGGIIRQFGSSAVLGIADQCSLKFSFLPGFEQIRNLENEPRDHRFRNVVILDAGSRQRIGKAEDFIAARAEIVNIDHHFTGKYYGNINLINVNASATAEIIYDLVKEWKLEFTKQIAYGIYTGLLTDTGRFRFSNTNGKALKICGEMVDAGVNPCIVTEMLYYNTPIEVMKSLSWALDHIHMFRDGTICILQLDLDHTSSDTEGFIEFASSIRRVGIAAFICEIEKNIYKISIRSKCRVDVSEIAKKLGGGGHRKAAGFKYVGSWDNLLDTIIPEINRLIDRQYPYFQDLIDDLTRHDLDGCDEDSLIESPKFRKSFPAV